MITWLQANEIRSYGVILNPEWEYENQELTELVKQQFQALLTHCEIDQKILEKATEQNNQQNPA